MGAGLLYRTSTIENKKRPFAPHHRIKGKAKIEKQPSEENQILVYQEVFLLCFFGPQNNKNKNSKILHKTFKNRPNDPQTLSKFGFGVEKSTCKISWKTDRSQPSYDRKRVFFNKKLFFHQKLMFFELLLSSNHENQHI